MKTRFVGAASACALILCAGTASAADQIRVLIPTWLGYAPLHVAQETGCFARNNLDVPTRFEDDQANIGSAMQSGDIDLFMRTVGEFQGRPRDANTTGLIIGTIDESAGGDGVIADGSIKSIADLKGKTVAAEPNIPARLVLQLELKKAGLTLNDLSMRDIAAADTAAIFSDPSISAIATYEPYMSQAILNSARPGARVIASTKDYSGIIVDAIVARTEDLKANPDKYVRFLRCIYEAVDFIKANPDQFYKIAGEKFGLKPEEVKKIVDTSLSYNTLQQARDYLGEPGKPGRLFGIFDTVMELNLENGAADNRLIATNHIDNSIIAKLR